MLVFLTLLSCADTVGGGGGLPDPPPEEPEETIEFELKTVSNPLIRADTPDPSVIRMGKAYYMVSTTMYFSPGAPIMKSYDLVNWKLVNYVYDVLEDIPRMNLEETWNASETDVRIGDYGRGQWAASLRYHNRQYYVCFRSNTTAKSYFFTTGDIEKGPWRRTEIAAGGFHDPSLFFEGGMVYVVHGYGTTRITELRPDLSGVLEGGLDKVIVSSPDVASGTNFEGAHIYKLWGRYYLFLISWPSGGKRSQLCYRADSLEGPWEGKVVLSSGLGTRSAGVAQGGIVSTPKGDWYGFLFQDRGAVGRVPVLVPVHWGDDGWPVFGVDGVTPETLEMEVQKDFEGNIVVSDDFDAATLPLAWQWNHNPDNANWSLSVRPGFMRITTGRVSPPTQYAGLNAAPIYFARNTLTQRTFEPAGAASVAVEVDGMKDGDVAGFAAFQYIYGFAGVTMEDGQKYVVMRCAPNNNGVETEQARVPFSGGRVYFKIACEFPRDQAAFYYSGDGADWQALGTPLTLSFQTKHFTGYRFALFYYAARTPGGHVDFDYFRLENDTGDV
jgi:beta-xylosidase